jgi:hypothetical protein
MVFLPCLVWAQEQGSTFLTKPGGGGTATAQQIADSIAAHAYVWNITMSVVLDSSLVNVTDTVWVDLPGYAFTIDSVSLAPSNNGTAVAITPKFLYRSAPFQTATAIVTTPGGCTSAIAKTWYSTIAAATTPVDGQLGVCFTTVTTKPKQLSVGFKVHR